MVRSRTDIQIMRAVAVLAVIIFHYQPVLLPSGFLGVDIFFAISGYLITGQIVTRIESGSWSFSEFYRRRIQRLFPSLLCTISGSLVTAYFLISPERTLDFLWSAMLALCGLSNVFFFLTKSYFAPSAESIPLLHTWSLGVEEQFYIIWPLILFLILARKNRLILAFLTAAIIVTSLLSAHFMTSQSPEAVFSVLPFRAFELLAGALSFLLSARIARAPQKPLVASAMWVALLATLVFSSPDDPLSGGVASVLLTSLLLGMQVRASPKAERVLSPIAYVGDISYSLYLVHWPLFVFWRMRAAAGDAGPLSFALLLTACFLLAALQYHLVEDPIRKSRDRWFGFSRHIVRYFAVSAAAMIALVVSGAATSGWGFRLDGGYVGYAFSSEERASQYDEPNCFRSSDYRAVERFESAGCIRAKPGQLNVVLFGDSTVAQYSQLIRGVAKRKGWTLSQLTASSCVPAIDWNDRRDQQCGALVRDTLEFVERSKTFDVIVLSGNYFDHRNQRVRLVETIARLTKAGVRVVFLGPLPRYDRSLPELLSQTINGGAISFDLVQSHILDQPFEHDKSMRQVITGSDATYVSLIDLLCNRATRTCQLLAKGAPVQSDAVHLTPEGAGLVIPAIVEAIEKA
jgi:peptidoglycan/LPS O-acetylase OafA/YrhL